MGNAMLVMTGLASSALRGLGGFLPTQCRFTGVKLSWIKGLSSWTKGVLWNFSILHGRGRDEDCSSPPAQIPACAANAPGSSLGFWRRSDDRAKGAAF